MKKIGVALLGLGVVGGGVYSILNAKHDIIMKNEGVDIEVVKVLERNVARCEELGVCRARVAGSIDEIVNDESIDIVAEFFGGVEPAKSFLKLSLLHGKSIVTANKEMLSKCWSELEEAAEGTGAGIYFEASCVGGVPVIRTLCEAMQANEITSLKGIVNGTTNYILSKMTNDGEGYDVCLKEAQRLGYAEADPTADVEGFDATYKNSILSSLAYKARVSVDKIYREGISKLDIKDINIAKELGYTIKLLAISKQADGKIEARVHPTLIESTHPLAGVSGPFNALYIHGDNVDDIMLYGRGAGAFPTASAIVSDIVYAAKASEHRHYPFVLDKNEQSIEPCSDFECGYYVRIEGCAALESDVLGALEKQGIDVKKHLERGDKGIVLLTQKTHESTIKNALNLLLGSHGGEIAAFIRVEE